jgi:L-lactate dehydrogenase (cytochrome)
MGNRERDRRTGFTVPPTHSAQQLLGAAARPRWSWDFCSTDEYTYALAAPGQSAEAMASFLNSQIDSRFDWADAKWLCDEWPRLVAAADRDAATTAAALAEASAAAHLSGGHAAAHASPPPLPPLLPPPVVLLKGTVRADEAARAVGEAGFGGVWVSNHGGRQLETAPPPINVLPSIR